MHIQRPITILRLYFRMCIVRPDPILHTYCRQCHSGGGMLCGYSSGSRVVRFAHDWRIP